MSALSSFDSDRMESNMLAARPYLVVLDVSYIVFVIASRYWSFRISGSNEFLRVISIVWNALNSVFSWYVVLSLLPEVTYALFVRGWDYALCTTGDFYSNPYSGPAMYLFAWSKTWELGDTLLLILRGRPVLFLHAYHHAIVLIHVPFSYKAAGSFARLATMMNAIVHAFMYAYFAATSVWPSVRKVSRLVTGLQILQFCIGCYGILYAWYMLYTGQHCETDRNFIPLHIFVYGSFLTLFVHFFYGALTRKPQAKKEQ